jgi:hypothetical protein
MKPMSLAGIVLVVLGALALAYQESPTRIVKKFWT